MAYHVVTCNGYKTLSSHISRRDAMTAAERAQDEATDDYAILISSEGRFIGDPIEGWYPPDHQHQPDHATLTGMYDRY